MGNYTGSRDGITWREIVLEHIRKILENSRVEFHGGYWHDTGSNPVTRTYVHNSREAYFNGIKSLSDILLPFFDKDMITANKKFEEDWAKRFELAKESFQKEFGEKATVNDNERRVLISKQGCILARILFQELNKLLKRTDFLKSAIYEEEEDGE